MSTRLRRPHEDARERVRDLRHGRVRRARRTSATPWQAHAEVELVGSVGAGRRGCGRARRRPPPRRPARARAAASLPAHELAAIREYTRAPVVLLASVESAALLEEALEADVADVLLLPQLTENVVFAIRKAATGPARGGDGQARPARS